MTIASYGSVRLLRDRAVAVRPDFELGEANAAAVARICRALDGMPLAIELAAVWLRTLTPAQLAERLDDRFGLLTGGSRTALPRHRTLRAVVDWSWDLLSASEQVLARRLAVFPGGATLAAAEYVCADELLPPAAVLPALSGLVDKSILGVAEGQDGLSPRYRMLETVRAYGLERLAEAGEEAAVRDAFAAYYLDLAETADPGLRAAGQGRWLRELTAEQDNLHAALRWTIARQQADTALRFVRALGWYWMLRGQPGEPEVLARQVLAFEPREQTPRMAEARVVCAITAAGDSWEIDTVGPALAAAVADLNRWSPDTAPSHPIAAMGEPMLALYDGDPDRAFAVFDRYMTSEDPWVRAAVPLLRGTFGSMLGRMDWAESDCRDALAAFRALGEAWGTAAVLIQLAEFARLRGENAAAVAALEEAGALGKQLGAWGDLSHIGGKLAAVRLRMGDLAGARADLERAEREEAARGIGQSDSATWLGLVRAELLYREGDTAAAGRICAGLLAQLEEKQSSWWFGVQAIIQARLALIALADGDEARCRTLLAAALQTATSWVELPPVADVIDAIAVLAQHSGECATAVATLLGAAHAIRGCFDEGSLDAPAVRDAARARLGADEFEAAYERGRGLPRDDVLALAAGAVANPVTARCQLTAEPHRLGAAPVDPDGQRGEHDEDAERPQQRLDRGGGHRAAGEQAALRVGQQGHRVDLDERLQPARHGAGRREQVAAEHEREERDEPEGLHSLRGLHQHADEGRCPAQGQREGEEQQAAGHGGERVGRHPEAQDHPEADGDRDRDEIAHHVAEDGARERRPAGDRQAAEPVEDPAGDVLVEHEPGAQGGEHHGHDEQPGQLVLQVVVRAAVRDGAAENVGEQQQEHDRLQAQADHVLHVRPDLQARCAR